jgi:N-acetylmuramoyl-L-alanine amidase
MHTIPRFARVLLAVALGFTISATPLVAARARPTVASKGPLAGMVIALDPGHGGGNASHPAQIHRLVWIGNRWKACSTVGTSTRGGYPEHAFTFDVALRVKASLQALGATVYMTRTDDTGVSQCIDAIGKFGQKVHAVMTVSIHGDGSGLTHRGFFVMRPGLVRGYTDDILARSGVLARAMRDGLVAAGLPVANYYAKNGIVSRTDLGTFNMSNVPVVMIELGNMKNSTDAARMTSRSGRNQYANGIVNGIRRYLGR